MSQNSFAILAKSDEFVRLQRTGTWMMKPGSKSSGFKFGIGGGWARRHVWIESWSVHYGPKEKKSEKSIPLSELKSVRNATAQEVGVEKGPGNLANFGFWMQGGGKTIIFCAENLADRDLWVRVLGLYLKTQGRDNVSLDREFADDESLYEEARASMPVLARGQSTISVSEPAPSSVGQSPRQDSATRAKSQSVISNFNTDEIDELLEEEESIREILVTKQRKEFQANESVFHSEYEICLQKEAQSKAEERSQRAASAARDEEFKKAQENEDRNARAAAIAREEAERKQQAKAEQLAAFQRARTALSTNEEAIARQEVFASRDAAFIALLRQLDAGKAAAAAAAASRVQRARDQLRTTHRGQLDALLVAETTERDMVESRCAALMLTAEQQRAKSFDTASKLVADRIASEEAARKALRAKQSSAFFASESEGRSVIEDDRQTDWSSMDQTSKTSRNSLLANDLARIANDAERRLAEHKMQASAVSDSAASHRERISSEEQTQYRSMVQQKDTEGRDAVNKSLIAAQQVRDTLARMNADARNALHQLEKEHRQTDVVAAEEIDRRIVRDAKATHFAAATNAAEARILKEAEDRQQRTLAAQRGFFDSEFKARMIIVGESDSQFTGMLTSASASQTAAAQKTEQRKSTERRSLEERLSKEQEAVSVAEGNKRSTFAKELSVAYLLIQNEFSKSKASATDRQNQRVNKENADMLARFASERQSCVNRETHARREAEEAEAAGRATLRDSRSSVETWLSLRVELRQCEAAERTDSCANEACEISRIHALHDNEKAHAKQKGDERKSQELESLRQKHKTDRLTLEQLETKQRQVVTTEHTSTKKGLALKFEHDHNALHKKELALIVDAEQHRKAVFSCNSHKLEVAAAADAENVVTYEVQEWGELLTQFSSERSSLTEHYAAIFNERINLSRIALTTMRGLEDQESTAFEGLAEAFRGERVAISSSDREKNFLLREIEAKRQMFREQELRKQQEEGLRLKRVRQDEITQLVQAGCWTQKPGSQSNKPGASTNIFFGKKWQKRFIWVAGDNFCYGAEKKQADQSIPLRTIRRARIATPAEAEKDNCPKEQRSLAFRIDTWDKYYLFSTSNETDRKVFIEFFMWRVSLEEDAGVDDDAGADDLSLAESVSNFNASNDDRASQSSRKQRGGSQGTLSPSPSPNNRGGSNAQTYQSFPMQPAQKSKSVSKSNRELVVQDCDELQDLLDEQDAVNGGTVKAEVKARQRILEQFSEEKPKEAKSSVQPRARAPSTTTASAPPPQEDSRVNKGATPSSDNNNSSPQQTAPKTSSQAASPQPAAPPTPSPAVTRPTSVSIISSTSTTSDMLLKRKLALEQEEREKIVTRGAWMHKPKSKKTTGLLKGFSIGGSSWNKRFVWVSLVPKNHKICYGESQGKPEKEVPLSTIRSVHIVSPADMKTEGAEKNMCASGWRVVADDRTILFAAPDSKTRKFFVDYLSPATPITETRLQGTINEQEVVEVKARSAVVNSHSGADLEEEDFDGDYDYNVYDENEEYYEDDPFEEPANTTTSAGETRTATSPKGGAVAPTAPGAGGSKWKSVAAIVRVGSQQAVFNKPPREPSIPLSSIKDFVERVNNGCKLNKNEGLVGAALCSGEGLVIRKCGTVDDKFAGKAVRMCAIASKLHRHHVTKNVLVRHIDIELEDGTITTVGAAQDDTLDLIVIGVTAPTR